MPLPKNQTPWPPASAHGEALAEWSAWYSGDPDQLSAFYGSRNGTVAHPNQLRGGVVGRIARWWWGVPTGAGEQRSKLHVPLAADICGTSADLLFSEPVQLTSDNDKVAEALQTLQDNGLDSRLHEGAEVQAALGGVYLRTVWDSDVSDMPWTEVAHPDGAEPEFRNGRLYAVNLWSELGRLSEGTVHRLVERHEKGAIQYGLYEGTATNLGNLVPLQDHPETEHLALLPLIDGNTQTTGLDRLTVAYVPNMLPNRLNRRSQQGRSDLQGVTPWLDALDEAYSSWWRDIRHAKARLHVPAQYLDSNGPGQGASVDLDREVYVPVEGVLATNKDGLLIDAQQFKIRVAEHRDTCEHWTNKIIESAGYSTQSLSSGSGGAVTAAEVHSHERRSYMTRGKKVRYWTAALYDHLQTQLEVANTHLKAGLPVEPFSVEFQDGVQESAMSLAQTTLAMRNAESASIRTRVLMLHPDWDKDEVDTEVAAIMRETGVGEPVPVPDDAGL